MLGNPRCSLFQLQQSVCNSVFQVSLYLPFRMVSREGATFWSSCGFGHDGRWTCPECIDHWKLHKENCDSYKTVLAAISQPFKAHLGNHRTVQIGCFWRLPPKVTSTKTTCFLGFFNGLPITQKWLMQDSETCFLLNSHSWQLNRMQSLFKWTLRFAARKACGCCLIRGWPMQGTIRSMFLCWMMLLSRCCASVQQRKQMPTNSMRGWWQKIDAIMTRWLMIQGIPGRHAAERESELAAINVLRATGEVVLARPQGVPSEDRGQRGDKLNPHTK